jgi:hypothetical protein
MIAQLMGTDTVRVWHDQVQIKPARIGGPTVWHQDHPYWPVISPPTWSAPGSLSKTPRPKTAA